jgi:alkanesulfonate monooxygenase SsuD/methylene tetrahydromethanopterin reductase-like flavin-dependent oxidoreductase (luciferase family)
MEDGRLRIGFKASQWGVSWAALLATWELADAMPEFDSGWLFDHFTGVRQGAASDDGAFEAMALASALATRTRRLRFGHTVLGNTHRHPALVAAMASTIDHVAGPGRFVLGLGAGWLEEDHRRFGWDLPAMGERLDRLDAAVRIIKGMWREPGGISLDAGGYQVRDARIVPAPLTRDGPPIWIGTQGPRGLGIIARSADGWNANLPVDKFSERLADLWRLCEAAHRDPAEIEISAQVMCLERTSVEVRDVATRFIIDGARHIIFVIRASDGPDGLAGLASEVVAPLRDRFG